MKVSVVIPAHNEEASIGKVIQAIPKGVIQEVIVVSNCSTDNTDAVAEAAGAIVLIEARKGYGSACLKGVEYCNANGTDVILFMDGDFSDHPEESMTILDPILTNEVDFVVGSRVLGKRERGSLTPQQVFGNWLATSLVRIFYRARFTDLGPFRAIRMDALERLKMSDKTYGWTIEMQLKAVKKKLRWKEVPVNYKKRIGKSKVSGTVKGTLLAGIKIIFAVFKYLF